MVFEPIARRPWQYKSKTISELAFVIQFEICSRVEKEISTSVKLEVRPSRRCTTVRSFRKIIFCRGLSGIIFKEVVKINSNEDFRLYFCKCFQVAILFGIIIHVC